MPQTEKKDINSTQIEATIRVTKSEAMPMLAHAAERMSQARPIKGFRPGKAPLEIVKKIYGEPAVLEEAMDDIVNETLSEFIKSEQINPYGKIGFDLLPVVNPEEILAFRAVITKMPQATLGNWQKDKIKRQEIKISDDDLNKALDEMAVMLIKEEPADKSAEKSDKVIIDFDTFIDGKLIEGGKASDFELILGEAKMIPGFEEKIIGTKAGEEIKFTLNFPADDHAKHLGGKPADFKVTVKQVILRAKPKLNDELAKRVGAENLTELKERLEENILKEKTQREEEKVEIAAIRQLAETSTYTELPAEMVAEAAHELVHEFSHSIAHQGMQFEQYLQSIGKKEADLIKEFEPRAAERIKASMALGKLAEEEKIAITGEEVDAEIASQKKMYAQNQKALADINQPEYRRHVANSMINRKIIDFLKQKLIE